MKLSIGVKRFQKNSSVTARSQPGQRVVMPVCRDGLSPCARGKRGGDKVR